MGSRIDPILSSVGGFEAVKRNWGWFVALGIVQIVLGTIALGESVLMTLFSVVMLGWILIIGGLFSIFHAFVERQWRGFVIDLLTGLLYVAVGFMMVGNPGELAVTLTLLIALFLIFGGVSRMVEALIVRGGCPHSGWVFLNGVVTLVMGVMIWRRWPSSGLWVIGLFVGIEMILYGWSSVMLGLAARRTPTAVAAPA